MNRVKLAFAGKMHVGKDTAIRIWDELSGLYGEKHPEAAGYLTFSKLAFADPLKHVCRYMFNLSTKDTDTQEGKDHFVQLYDRTVRQLLQDVGQAMRDGVDRDIWVKMTMSEVDRLLEHTRKNILISDVRYINELVALKTRGFTLVKIVRDTGLNSSHPSESDIDDKLFDHVIDNNGSMADFTKKLLKLPEYHFENIIGE